LREAEVQAKEHKEGNASAIPQALLDSVPSVRTVERVLKREWEPLSEEAKGQYRSSIQKADELDQPWSIAASIKNGLPDSALGDLLAVWKLTILLKQTDPYPVWTFTIRQARWVARLRAALPDAGTSLLFRSATLYSRRERTAESQGGQLDTSDLDAELAFQHWKSPLHEWEYDQAVLSGAVPASRYSEAQEKGVVAKALRTFPEPLGYFASHGRGFLRAVGGVEIWQRPWWPQAESVMAHWLRNITTKVKRWQGINWGSGGGLPGDKERKEWKAMGRRLATLVIEQAEALQRYIDSAQEREAIWRKLQIASDMERAAIEDGSMEAWNRATAERNHPEVRFVDPVRTVTKKAWNNVKRLKRMNNEIAAESQRLPEHPDYSAAPVNGQWQAWRPTELLNEIGYDEKGDTNA
jgi:hypothetical protein